VGIGQRGALCEKGESIMLRIEQLKQLTTVTWDGDLISKSEQESLEKTGLVQRAYGFNFITKKGVEYLVNLGILKIGKVVKLANLKDLNIS
jgi:hypothetical protein